MTIDDFKKAQKIQLKIAAMIKLREMLKQPHVVLTAGSEPESDMMAAFGTIFGEDEKRLINKEIADDMVSMVNARIKELEVAFGEIGDNRAVA